MHSAHNQAREMRLFAFRQGAPSGVAVVVPFDNKQKVEDVLKVLCVSLKIGGNTEESWDSFELRLASNNCLLVPSDLACTVLSDGDSVVVGKDNTNCSRRIQQVKGLWVCNVAAECVEHSSVHTSHS